MTAPIRRPEEFLERLNEARRLEREIEEKLREMRADRGASVPLIMERTELLERVREKIAEMERRRATA